MEESLKRCVQCTVIDAASAHGRVHILKLLLENSFSFKSGM